jgi:dTDP-4-dehydrorhamnose 3,5-epimerase
MNVTPTRLPGVLVLEPRLFPDPRGVFYETYNQRSFAQVGIHSCFVQDNHSQSQRGTVRGLHYQLRHPQAKLCRVVRGAVLDVVADIRVGSPTFGQWISVELSAANKKQIFVPRGFAHGFAVLSDEAEFLYKCDDFYAPGDEYGVAWNCPLLQVDWQSGTSDGITPVLSEKDAKYAGLAEIPIDQLPQYQSE